LTDSDGRRVRKTYGAGLTLLSGYSSMDSKTLVYYDDVATYLQERTWQPDTQPRHRFTFGGAWELPFGKGRRFPTGAPRFADGFIGGWSVSPTMTWRSGNLLSFPGLIANGDPRIDNPGPDRWFDTSVFAQLPALSILA
jgi:hypothetical protein